MRRRWIAGLLALAMAGCSAMAALSALDLSRTWGTRAVCSITSLSIRDLSVLTALYPDLGWTAYAQSAPRRVSNETLATGVAEAAVLSFLGAPERVAFFPVLSGRLPLDGERAACALDKNTAFWLFGSTDPSGGSVRINGQTARVVGVLDMERPLVLAPAAQDATFDRLAADDRDALLALQNALDTQADPFELSGAELAKLAWLLCAAPWLLAAVHALAALRRRGGAWRAVATALLWALPLGALLAVLWCVPVRLLPARWSDFAFYGKQWSAWQARPFRAPDVRDELLSADLLRTGLWCAVSCAALWAKRRTTTHASH